MTDSESTRFRRSGFVTVVSAEEQKAVYISAELVDSAEHGILRRPPAAGWLGGMDDLAHLRRELGILLERADERQRAAVEEAADLVDYSLKSGRAFIAVFRG